MPKNDSKEGSSELTARGLVTFRKVVFDRKEELYNRIHDDLDNEQFITSKKPLYHRSCQNKYVYSKLLNVGTPNVNEGPSTGKKRKAIDFKEVCFICEKVRDRKKNHKMFLVATKSRLDSIYLKACDDVMIMWWSRSSSQNSRIRQYLHLLDCWVR